jgi:hypothetical protein
MNKLHLKTGTEGPRHDPYGYDELTFVSLLGRVVTLHSGLMNWLKVNGQIMHPPTEEVNDIPLQERINRIPALYEKMFYQLTGLTVKRALKIIENRDCPTRCPKCRSKNLEQVDGYIGESLVICGECNTIVSSRVDIYSIM